MLPFITKKFNLVIKVASKCIVHLTCKMYWDTAKNSGMINMMGSSVMGHFMFLLIVKV